MMEIETQVKNINQIKPENMLLLQQSMLESRIFPVFTLQEALQKMIKIYGEATTLINAGNQGDQNIVCFSLKSMIQYFQNMENLTFMQKDKSSSPSKGNQKYKTQLQSYDKQFVLASLKNYCVKKSVQNSIQIAKLAYKNDENIEDVLKNMGFQQ